MMDWTVRKWRLELELELELKLKLKWMIEFIKAEFDYDLNMKS